MSSEPSGVGPGAGAPAPGESSNKVVIAVVAGVAALLVLGLCCVAGAGFLWARRAGDARVEAERAQADQARSAAAGGLQLTEMQVKEGGLYKGVIAADGSIQRDGLWVGKLDGTSVQVDGLWKGELSADGGIKVDGQWKGELAEDGSLKWDGQWRCEIGDDGSVKVDGQYVVEVDGFQPTPVHRRAVAAYLVFFARVFG